MDFNGAVDPRRVAPTNAHFSRPMRKIGGPRQEVINAGKVVGRE